MKTWKAWTERDKKLLRELWADTPLREAAEALGRSANAVSVQAHRMGLKKEEQRDWTEEEVSYLRERYQKDGPTAVAQALGRSYGGTASKGSKLGLAGERTRVGTGKLWTEEETRRLRESWGRMPDGELARRLGRTESACRNKARALGLPRKGPGRKERYGKRWTEEELRYIRENWGEKPLRHMARGLKRPETTVTQKARSMGLRKERENGILTMDGCRSLMGIDQGRMERLIREHGLPVRQKAGERKNRLRYVREDELADWMQRHQDLWDSRRVAENALGFEWAWLKKKRARDRQLGAEKKGQGWTMGERQRLLRMREKGVKARDIAKALGRTTGGVNAMVRKTDPKTGHIRKLPPPRRKKWTEDEERRLLELREAKVSYRDIGWALGRSRMAIRDRLVKLRAEK